MQGTCPPNVCLRTGTRKQRSKHKQPPYTIQPGNASPGALLDKSPLASLHSATAVVLAWGEIRPCLV
jgi:hypothetical protein